MKIKSQAFERFINLLKYPKKYWPILLVLLLALISQYFTAPYRYIAYGLVLASTALSISFLFRQVGDPTIDKHIEEGKYREDFANMEPFQRVLVCATIKVAYFIGAVICVVAAVGG